MGEPDNAKVSLYKSYYNFGLIIVCRIEEYAVMLPLFMKLTIDI